MNMDNKDIRRDNLFLTTVLDGLETAVIITDQNRVTPVKTRYIADNYQSFRTDSNCQSSQISLETKDSFLNTLAKIINQYDAVILSDYNYGLLDDEFAQYLCFLIVNLCSSNGFEKFI